MKQFIYLLLAIPFVSLLTTACEEVPGEESGGTRVEKISLNIYGSSMEIVRSRQFQLEVTMYPEEAPGDFNWINSNPDVVSISETGLLTTLLEGQAIIGAETPDKRKRAVATITVTKYIAENPIASIIFDKTSLDFADISDPPQTIVPDFVAVNTDEPPTLTTLRWTTSNPMVVQVSQEGVVKIIGGGSATIRAEAIDGGEAFAECPVTVPGTAIKDRNFDSIGPLYSDNYYKIVYEPIEIVMPVLDRDGMKTGQTVTQVWLDRNLGAKRRATAFNDYESFGSMFQWSRKADGHEKVVWTAANAAGASLTETSDAAAADRANVGHSRFITVNDWASADSYGSTGLWGGSTFSITAGAATDAQFSSMKHHAPVNDPTQANNPCPYGYRVPSVYEVHQLMIVAAGLDKIIYNNNGNTASSATTQFGGEPFYLPFVGNRAFNAATTVANVGTWMMYWTNSAQSAANAWPMRIQNTGSNFRVAGQQRAQGYSVRCIKD